MDRDPMGGGGVDHPGGMRARWPGDEARSPIPSTRRETIMADTDDEAAVERVARRIFELQNPGKPWPGDAQAKAGEPERYRALAKKELGTKES
jgi:hypothetical protein